MPSQGRLSTAFAPPPDAANHTHHHLSGLLRNPAQGAFFISGETMNTRLAEAIKAEAQRIGANAVASFHQLPRGRAARAR